MAVFRACGAFALALAIVAASWSAPAQEAATPVGVAPVEMREVSAGLAVVGRVEAIDRVEIRARVTGFLEEVAFTEGQRVEAGDLLYRIEPDEFRAAVRQAEGALEQARAARALADIQLKRAQELLDKAAGTAVARDQAAAEAARSAGEVTSAEARLAKARIDLGYTEIRAPVAGRIDRTAITRGGVVGPDSGPLTLIVSDDPIHVVFPVSASEFLKPGADGRPRDPADVRVRLRFSGGEVYEHESTIDFVGVAVDAATDTVPVRATFPNPERKLLDGQLVQVRLEAADPVLRPVVPTAALIADQAGLYVLVVEDGKAAARRVRPGPATGAETAIEEGLAAGDLVIVEGLERVRPGAAVLAGPAASGTD